MKRIKDPIHSYILLEDPFVKIVDSPYVQRLRYIKQLGTAGLVYPGANHTRFEHSLGTYNLAKSFADALCIKHREEFMAAALLHDVGHGPFSHISDSIAKKRGYNHVEASRTIIENSELRDMLGDIGIDPRRITDTIRGEPPYGCLLSGSLDVDRLDYLMRDSYYTGANFGHIDIGRLLTGTKIFKNKVVVDENCIATVESILVFRSLMYPTVYYHHTVRIAAVMLEKAIEEEMNNDMRKLMGMDDISLIALLRARKNGLWRRIERRDLYKIAYTFTYDHENRERAEEIQDKVRAISQEAIVDIIEPPIWREMDVEIMTAHGKRRIGEVSTLANSLMKAQKDHYKLVVYAPKEKREEVAQKISEKSRS
ncbi:MAG: HD domain-containing protein [Candidatus Thermoplasmatota archaeon]|nr:HD domain-containing protein [Candidatus Thermoplasmatota archaeon]